MVIPALDEANQIESAVRNVSAPGIEIVVVDGGSRDGTPTLARAAGAEVLHSEPNRARQLQVGLVQTRAEVVLFLHADTRLPQGWENDVRTAMRDPAVVGGAFRLHFDDSSLALRIVEWAGRIRSQVFRLPFGDQGLFARREVLDRIGGIPLVPVMEDLDLVAALRREGKLVLLARRATTSARRYRDHGILRTVVSHNIALIGWHLGVDRMRLKGWLGR